MATYTFTQSSVSYSSSQANITMSGTMPAASAISQVAYAGNIAGSSSGASATIWISIYSSSGSLKGQYNMGTETGLTQSSKAVGFTSTASASGFKDGLMAMTSSDYILMQPVRSTGTFNSATNFTFTVTYTAVSITAPGAPTSLTPATTSTSNTGSAGQSITLSWSGASAGTNNAITGYTLEYSDGSSLPGTSWSSGTTLTTISSTSTSGSYSTAISSTSGYYRRWRIRTNGASSNSAYVYFGAYQTIASTAASAPSSLTPATSSTGNIAKSGTTLTLSWSGASAGTNNSITGYEIEYSDSSSLPNTSWSSGTALAVVSTTSTSGSRSSCAISGTRGNYRRWRVRTQGSAGSSYYSSWAYFGAYRTNILATPPTTATLSPTTAYVGDTVTLTWSGAKASATNTLAQRNYYIHYNTGNTDSWSENETTGNGTVTFVIPSGVTSAYAFVRYIDSFGEWSTDKQTNTITISTRSAVTSPTTLSPTTTNGIKRPSDLQTLSWSGAVAGTNNAITGYEFEYTDGASLPGTSWTGTALSSTSSTSTSGSREVALSPTRGYFRRWRMRTIGSQGEAYQGAWVYFGAVQSNILATAPTTATLPSSAIQGATVPFNWSGAAASSTSTLASYTIVIYRNGVEQTPIVVNSSATSGTYQIMTSTADVTIYASIYYTDSLGENSATKTTSMLNLTAITAVTSPTTLSPNTTTGVVPYNASVVLTWSGAAAGSANSIAGYEIEYQDNASLPGTSWISGTLVTSITSSATSGTYNVAASLTAGNYRRWRIRAVGSAGSSYDGEWVYFGAVRTNILATPPTSVSLSPSTYAPGDQLTLTWSGAAASTTNTLVSAVITFGYEGLPVSSVTVANTTGSGSYTFAASDVSSITVSIEYIDSIGETSAGTMSNTVTRVLATAVTSPNVVVPDTDSAVTIIATSASYNVTWSGELAGYNNAVSGFEIQYKLASYSNVSSLYYPWASAGTSVQIASGVHSWQSSNYSNENYYYRARIRALGIQGDPYNGEWVYFGMFRSATKVTAPTSTVLSPEEYMTGDTLTLTWSGATTNGLTTMKIREVTIYVDGVLTTTTNANETTGAGTYSFVVPAGANEVYAGVRYRDSFNQFGTKGTSNTVYRKTVMNFCRYLFYPPQ